MSDLSTASGPPQVTSDSNNQPLSSPPLTPQLVDRFGRVHRSLRISVTDACNIRCQYCMPAAGAVFLPSDRLLSFTQLESFVRTTVAMGIRKVRLTGGEPLLRPNLAELVNSLHNVQGLESIALTTNGMLLARHIDDLVAAGLRRINISLDTLSEPTFRQLTRREGLQRVLEGIESTRAHPQLEVRLNALILRDVNLDDVCQLVAFARPRSMTLRFIEFMPLDSDRSWSTQRMISGDELRALVAERFGPLRRCTVGDPSQPAAEYEFVDGGGRVGFIDSVSNPFCSGCDRLRLTADGKVRNCLFGREEWDVAALLKEEVVDSQRLADLLTTITLAKHAAHGIAAADFEPPHRAMYQIGG